jgi:hypothetical protein
MQQVRNRDISAEKGIENLQGLSLKCEAVRDLRFIDAARESIGEYEARWRSIPKPGQSRKTM